MDFNNTIIYKFVCNDLNITDIYVGHTTNFIQRKCCHKSSCNNEGGQGYNLKIYTTIRATGGWDNWAMIQIEEYPCNNGNEATARERYWIETLHSILNSNIPNRTRKEWYEDNADKIKNNEKSKQFREQNRDKLNENARQNYKDNREQRIEQIKQYNKENAVKIKEKRRQYYKENADKFKEQYKAKKIKLIQPTPSLIIH